jgi:hypothetical protein
LGNDPGIPGAAAVVASIRWIGRLWPAHDLGVIEILLSWLHILSFERPFPTSPNIGSIRFIYPAFNTRLA